MILTYVCTFEDKKLETKTQHFKNFFDDKNTPVKAELSALIKKKTFHSSEGKMCEEL